MDTKKNWVEKTSKDHKKEAEKVLEKAKKQNRPVRFIKKTL